jgi:hypothetical protein
MAMAAMKVCSAQGFLGVRNRVAGVSDPKNGWFTQKWPFSGTIRFKVRGCDGITISLVHSGVFGGKFFLRRRLEGVCLCTLQENPHFWVPTIKVRPPDGKEIVIIYI